MNPLTLVIVPGFVGGLGLVAMAAAVAFDVPTKRQI